MSEPKYIYFFARKEKFHSLSNFSNHAVTIANRKYQTGEHSFHGEKYYLIGQNCNNKSRKEKLIAYSKKFQELSVYKTPAEAKRAGGKKGFALMKDELEFWDTVNIDVQKKICHWKITNYKEVKDDLKKK